MRSSYKLLVQWLSQKLEETKIKDSNRQTLIEANLYNLRSLSFSLPEKHHRFIKPIPIFIIPKNKELRNVPKKGNNTKGNNKVAIKAPR